MSSKWNELFDCDYGQARLRFLAAAQSAGAQTREYSHPSLRTVDDQPLFIDTARVGSENASHVFLIFSGTHGLEGLAGSAVQSDYLQSLPLLPSHAAILFVHGVNPYGVAHSSRTNEDNIDLNRNFIDHSSLTNTKTDVECEVQAILASTPVNFETLEGLGAKVGPLVEKYGAGPVINAVTAGQYAFPEGLNYGGEAPSWSNQTLRGIIKRETTQASRVVFLDWHSGLGSFGEPCYLCFNTPASPNFKRVHNWWGIDAGADESAFDTADSQPQYSGLLVQGLAEELPATAESVRAVIEFGTYDNMVMLGALMVDRWLRFSATTPLSTDDLELKQWMIERFYPSDSSWREAVITMSRNIHKQTLDGLLAWKS